jgi:hypothetical protein
MIQHHGNFAMSLPSTWTAPPFQFGQTVQTDERVAPIVGMEYVSPEHGEMVGCLDGWWIWLLEARTLSNGKAIADVMGYHESVIQAVPCLPSLQYECPVAV